MSRVPKPHPGIMAVMLPFVILLLLLIAFDPVKAMSRDDDSLPRVLMGESPDGHPTFTLQNDQVGCTITVAQDRIQREDIIGQRPWLEEFGAHNVRLELDGGFAWELIWNSPASTGQPVIIDHQAFIKTGHTLDAGTLTIHFRHESRPLEADVTWTLGDDDSFVRRRITLRDPDEQGHRLQRVWPRRGIIHDTSKLLKPGETGRFVAFTVQDGGAFLGLDAPGSTSTIEPAGCGAVRLECAASLDVTISVQGVASPWCVAAVTPEPDVQLWFDRSLTGHVQP